MKVRDLQHAVLPRMAFEDRSRQDAVVGLRRLLNAQVRPRNVECFETEAAPAFRVAHNRDAQSPDEVQKAFLLSPSYRRWSAANRSAQEMLWVAVGDPAWRDRARIAAVIRETLARETRGSLTLDSAYEPSAEVADVDIHLQPGGYAMDLDDGDGIAGALYECGGNVFSFGQGLGRGDSKAGVVIRLLDRDLGGFRPKRMLDIGCSAGAASAAYASEWPDCEVHAIDIGAAMLRYAHARAESLDAPVHFHQMDASRLSFADDSFDLVVSHNLLHEIGADKRRSMMAEAFRVVRPGGIVIHQDVAIRNLPTLVHQVERNWDTHFNGEAHWSTYINADLAGEMGAAGFGSEIVEHDLATIDGAGRWYAISARKVAI